MIVVAVDGISRVLCFVEGLRSLFCAAIFIEFLLSLFGTCSLRVVLGKNLATGGATLDFVDTLTDLDVKIKLLDIRSEGIVIPDEAPPLPPLPANYDFYYAAS